ncbi:hypothetical protein KC851_01690 [Candidatus Kaiserbacteria bacterium]|nr:hypothetical protein [Candidatus Kaiserbacteria bacterium]
MTTPVFEDQRKFKRPKKPSSWTVSLLKKLGVKSDSQANTLLVILSAACIFGAYYLYSEVINPSSSDETEVFKPSDLTPEMQAKLDSLYQRN